MSSPAKRWFLLFNQRDLRRGEQFFTRHGTQVVLLGRLVPLVRSVVSVPAGVTCMPLGRFTALTLVGSGVWNALFVYAGYRLATAGRTWGSTSSPSATPSWPRRRQA